LNPLKHTVFLLFLLLPSCTGTHVETGLDRLHSYEKRFTNKRVGIITNHTGIDRRGRSVLQCFLDLDSVTVTALFAPEHGITGRVPDGRRIDDDSVTRIPVFSLYGDTRKPTPDMLKEIDILVFDIQDIGARFYTYLSTMSLAMEAACEQSIPFVVLDRPNPVGGEAVEGPVLLPEFSSFVGRHPVPVRHGLTAGEMASLIQGEWMTGARACSLIVIPVTGWHRRTLFEDTGLEWIRPSPNIPDPETALVYSGLCLIEGINVSEGRGTLFPFRRIGAPWIRPDLAGILNRLGLPGVRFEPVAFTPRSIPSMAVHPKYEDKSCTGIHIEITNPETFRPFLTGLSIVKTLHDSYPDSLKWRETHFDRLCGTAAIREGILSGKTVKEIQAGYAGPLERFRTLRSAYLLYE
jgi:uncharacterized protein YbbC (DUF1343 family)